MIFTDQIIDYAERHTSDESPLLSELRQHCFKNYDDRSMLSGFVQGRVLSMFSHMIRPQIVLEIGTYLGYSALCFAEGLAEGGKVITLDVQPDTNRVARAFVQKSIYADRIEFHLGNAVDIIPTLPETFDLVFIDADKPNYPNYFDLVIDKVRPGGFIIADNVLWSGKVLDSEMDENTRALDEYNQKILADERVENVLLPIRDGLMVARKR
ncbi:MAG TPA: O-methyltransferase [Pyrinomonadaceae bacterium]|nr:class I SAM-dependent methyltransferase [Chloracidobacterium sp.]MBP9935755.1 class I SAM-dependent methyltransferase [Pyrinomonadaceae bacterium]MBK7801292.1 class I SAM-dependent methyltransferase [Chloracidobacterium sp.]MBK9436613.1 class I SAM-dependent methyltransferase [Chloracidobacterium sp.]MBL0241601.1 class I SAM-dependent methyltransferase [Chloracidobacterium sp.]